MQQITSIFKTFRVVNLLMIALTQFIVSQFVVQYYDVNILMLLIFSTTCIALGGYLLNDIADIEIDKANNKIGIINASNKKVYLLVAIALLILGNIIGFIACKESLKELFGIYVLASVSLILYAWFLSKYKIVGNVLISGLTALVILLCFYVEVNHYFYTEKYYFFKEIFIWFYAAIAFIINWLREMVKDIEDESGDTLASRISWVKIIGIKGTKAILITVSMAVFISLIFFGADRPLGIIHADLAIIIILFLVFMLQILSAKTTKNYKTASLLLKCIMIAGILIPVLF